MLAYMCEIVYTHIRLKFVIVYIRTGGYMATKELWITSAEASEILSANSGHAVSDSYVRRLGMNGKLSSKMIGGKTRLFNRAEVEAYRVKQRVKRETV